MDERSKRRIREHLEHEDVQRRIQRYIEKGRAEATVTISRAAELFNLSENRLRDWEEHGLLSPLRPTGPKGRRLYTPGELDKLAVIRELLDSGYSPSDIPSDIDSIWHTIANANHHFPLPERRSLALHGTIGMEQIAELPINVRIDQARSDLFWRYFVSHVLRLALMLICEEVPHTTACLLLPLSPAVVPETIQGIEDIPKLGESLVGWLSASRSSQTLLVSSPTFEYATDYRLLPLAVMLEDRVEEMSQDFHPTTYILLDRRSKKLTLTEPVVTTIRRLLQPLYEDAQRSRVCFGPGMRDTLDPSTDLANIVHDEDLILHGLAEMTVQLGGKTEEGQPYWHFCCILLPNYPTSILSIQQRALVVRAQSELSSYKLGVTTVQPLGSAIGPSLRAFQSGHIISLPAITMEDSHLTHNEDSPRTRSAEEPLRSALAVPVAGHKGMSIAVLYVASEYAKAFSEDDQRVLRLIGNMVGELLETYKARLQPAGKLAALISTPGVVDTLFRDFLSENEFATHVEAILSEALSRSEYQAKDVVSFIALDIDNQSSLANKYGDRMARDVSKAVGMRIHGQLRAFKDEGDYGLYRVNADRFYIVLKGLPLEQAQAKAELLRKVLNGSYQIDPQRAPVGQPTLPENMVTLSTITVRLAVSSYFYGKLREILQRYSTENAVVEARILLARFLDEVLDIGKREGGNVVMSWNPHARGIVRYSPPR